MKVQGEVIFNQIAFYPKAICATENQSWAQINNPLAWRPNFKNK